ncbi:hypothetical protein [Allosalinactinospora lopnorensis]|uniref:hypothetical protein n=1 Tax=Allosalinactinospora lopnorensis TaxID=1352348 RepID=UPI00069640D1|nr:hypothetical protein [Allosalinactinospora lopnorensis]
MTPEEREGPLLKRPYDFRHAGVTYRLNSGGPAMQIAEWAGRGVEVPYRVYAHRLDGDDDRWSGRMDDGSK